jgi:hypothetical protein
MASDDESKTLEKPKNEESKQVEKEISNAQFLLQTNEETINVKGTHVNFASKNEKEKTDLSTDQLKAQPDQSPSKNKTDVEN